MMERLTRRHKEEGWVTVIGESDSLSEHIVKLCEYEDAEEEGRMIILPVPIGTIVYQICFSGEDECWKIDEIPFSLEDLNDIGDCTFLTREKAKTRLKELEKEYE